MWNKKITYRKARPVLFYLMNEDEVLFLKHGFDKPLKEACVKEFYVLPFARREEEGTEAEKAVLDEPAFHVQASSEVRIRLDEENGIAELEFEDGDAKDCIREWKGVPRCDIQGNGMRLDFPDGDVLEETAYQFYWRTLLPCVAEKNAAADYPVGEGYVVSTLQKEVYAGTYPDVDHEFQIKGRIAAGDPFDLGLVKRMLNLQLKLMREDPEGLYRDPCALQPGGVREYHVRRSSMDGETNAVMFLVTGNIEVIESAWLYVAASGDYEWLKENREGLENALSLVIDCMDRYGRLWSDVYYEDQIIKDGRECMSAAMAARAMRLMAQLEELCGEEEKKKDYLELEKKLAGAMTASLPFGFWDTDKKRFADWVDRGSVCHDHIHLLANELPVLFDYATEEQSENVGKLLEEEWEEFQRFPTFLSARIADYTDSELGLPYDLCAAGRYWCWDFAYWLKQGRREVLKNQLLAVCAQAETDNYFMGERYDMNYVYYQSDINWHGAARYYEYPCVFLWNLIQGYLGVGVSLKADLRIAPMLTEPGKVRLDSFGVEYEKGDGFLRVKNLGNAGRSFLLCLDGEEKQVEINGQEEYLWQKQTDK